MMHVVTVVRVHVVMGAACGGGGPQRPAMVKTPVPTQLQTCVCVCVCVRVCVCVVCRERGIAKPFAPF